jgi:anti-sigma factor ChrR (cupin superfamily)
MMTDDLHALVLADAIGVLDETDQTLLHAALASLSPADQEAVGRLYDAALLVADAADVQEPPPHVRERVLASVNEPRQYTVTTASAWADSGVPGIDAKVLAIDRDRGLVTMLLRGSVGSIYPSHRHTAPEECYVVRGSISVGNLVLRAGDFHHADPDSDHGEIVVIEAAEVLLVAGIEDYLPH